MSQCNFKLLACWLSLAAFLFANCLGPRGVLLCTDASGNARFELGCSSAVGNDCREEASASTHDSSNAQCVVDDSSHAAMVSPPCTDTQLRSGDSTAQPPTRSDIIPPAFFLAALHDLATDLEPRRTAPVFAERSAPPDTQTHLRSVVLVI